MEKVPKPDNLSFFSSFRLSITVERKSLIRFSDTSFEKPNCIYI
jgi:hypothetical protein